MFGQIAFRPLSKYKNVDQIQGVSKKSEFSGIQLGANITLVGEKYMRTF